MGRFRPSAGVLVVAALASSLFAPGSLDAQTASLVILPQTTPALPGSTATASVTVEGSLDVSGFSYGLVHDPAILTLTAPDVTVGADLAATQGGAGPDFLSIDIFANGFTFATVINVDVAGTDLLANTAHEVTLLSYAVAATAQFGSTALVFTDTLGTPPVALSVGMGTQFVEPPTLTNASLFTTIPFLRGDVNENGQVTISDVIYLLTQLFAGAPLTCQDAADTDGSEVLSISDAVYVLAYLFDGGAAMPAPLGACGSPDTPSTLGCGAFSCP